MASDFPYMKFFSADWFADRGVRYVSFAARGLWIDLVCLMHESPTYGVLLDPTGKPMGYREIAKQTGSTVEEVQDLLAELGRAKVYSVAEWDNGWDNPADNQAFNQSPNQAIVCRRMMRDEKQRATQKANGAKGGNPSLLKQKRGSKDAGLTPRITHPDNQVVNPQSLRVSESHSLRVPEAQIPKEEINKTTGEVFALESPSEPARATRKAKPSQDTLPPGFERFWAAWPPHKRKDDKRACVARWKVRGYEEIADQIVSNVQAWKLSDDWAKDGGNFIPAPLVYLNSQRWEALSPTSSGLPIHQVSRKEKERDDFTAALREAEMKRAAQQERKVS
jgi:hypothetical protein